MPSVLLDFCSTLFLGAIYYSKSLIIADVIKWSEYITHRRKVISIPATALQICPYHPVTPKLQKRHIFLK